MKSIFFIFIVSTVPAIAADKNHMAEMTVLARENGIEAIREYFDKNSVLGQGMDGKSIRVLHIHANSFGSGWSEIEQKYNGYNRPIEKRVQNCNEISHGVRRLECLADTNLCPLAKPIEGNTCLIKKQEGTITTSYALSAPEELAPMGWQNKNVLASYRKAVVEAVAAANAEEQKFVAKMNQQNETWKQKQKACKAKGITGLVQAMVRVEKNLGGGLTLMRLNGINIYRCGEMEFIAEKVPKFFPLKGLSNPKQENCATIEMALAGTTVLKNLQGFNETWPLWRLISSKESKSLSSIIDKYEIPAWSYCRGL